MHLRRFASMSLLLIAGPTLAGWGDEVLLRRRLEPDQESHYRFEMVSKQTVTMPSGVTMPENAYSASMNYLLKNGSELENGRLPVDIKISDYEFASTPPSSTDGPKEIKARGFLDDRNSISDVRFERPDGKYKELMEASLQMLQSQWSLPEKPVKVGDTWEVTLRTAGAPGKKAVTFNMRFGGEKSLGGETYWVLTANEKIPLDLDMGPATPDGEPGASSMNLKGDMNVNVEVLLEKSGRLYSAVTGMTTDVKVQPPESTGQIHVVADTISKINLVR